MYRIRFCTMDVCQLLWWWTNVVLWCVGVAVIIHMWLAPWTWFCRRAMCWSRYALITYRGGYENDYYYSQPQTSTCPCCGDVDFDGMVGRWAVVTGCTDGIGKAFALQLAEKGMNVALISRNVDKLQAIAKEIHKRHGGVIQTRLIVADFTSSGGTTSLSETYEVVRRGLTSLDVAVLVNDAGISYTRPEQLIDLPPCCSSITCSTGHVSNTASAKTQVAEGDPCRNIFECNVMAPVAMCRIVMPLMINGNAVDGIYSRDDYQAEKQEEEEYGHKSSTPIPPSSPSTNRGGVVINISSISVLLPSPLLSLYAATKAFVYKFSVDLDAKYGGYDGKAKQPPPIAVRCVMPGFVATKMSRMRVGTFVPDPGTYVYHSLRSLSCLCGCQLARRLERDRISTNRNRKNWSVGKDKRWLQNLLSAAVFESPSSPFSLGHTGTTTSGYLLHTLMVKGINAAWWVLGDAYISKALGQYMRRIRDLILRRDANKAKAKPKLCRKKTILPE